QLAANCFRSDLQLALGRAVSCLPRTSLTLLFLLPVPCGGCGFSPLPAKPRPLPSDLDLESMNSTPPPSNECNRERHRKLRKHPSAQITDNAARERRQPVRRC